MLRCLVTIGLLTTLGAALGRAAETASQAIDRFIAAKWTRDKIQPAGPADDAELLRRLYLDLIGRIPCTSEVETFLNDKSADKRSRLIDKLLASGEMSQHWRENLNALLMGGPAFGGNPEWRAWLEACLTQNRKWDEMARAMLRARSEKPEEAGAAVFLTSRMAQGPSGVDLATRDVSRFFFGVDIQCARCHTHPEVDQWTQESYWGMAAFFNRSYPLTVKGKMYLAEKATGEMTYTPKGGKPPRTVAAMFLSGARLVEPQAPAPPIPMKAPTPAAVTADDPALYVVAPEAATVKTRVPVPKLSRRDKLVALGIDGKNRFFKRAIANYLWSQMMGRGLVEPLDQMHDANPASHPDLLAYLADDFVAHKYDLRYLIGAIAKSRTYQLSSRHPADRPLPAENAFAHAAARPLSLHQLATSVLVAVGNYDSFKAGLDVKTRSDEGGIRKRWEAQHLAALTSLVRNLDTGAEQFQPGIRESLFQANSAEFAGVVAQGGLVRRLTATADDAVLIHEAWLGTLARLPTKEEAERVRGFFNRKARATRARSSSGRW